MGYLKLSLKADTKKLYLVSLGCARNLVDSEVMLGQLIKAGWSITYDPAEAEIIIINTCSFIEPAVNESIDTIFEMARFKRDGACRRLIVTGCFPERFREEIVHDLPEVDNFLGTGAFDRIVSAAEGSPDLSVCLLPDPNLSTFKAQDAPRVRSSSHLAYIKIAEGCSRNCSYCIIPKLRGKQKSRPFEDIVAEAHSLIFSDVKELILIAQDTTRYGKDCFPPVDLSLLLKRISDISALYISHQDKADGIQGMWLRFLYGHPNSIDDSVIKTVATLDNVCSYFDIPIQHVSGSVLKKMGRNYTYDHLCCLFDKIRSRVPDAALRTTVIVGFPGETEKDFMQLLEFVEDVRFDHLGAFIYSDSKDLPSHKLPGHVMEKTATERYDRLMSVQAKISLGNNRNHIGRTYLALVEKDLKDSLFTGRTSFQAPEIDGITYIRSRARALKIGSFVRVRVTDVNEYDLIGEAV